VHVCNFSDALPAPACPQRSRLIIASDGLWDVYANEEAEQLSRGTRMDAPRSSADCATLLASRALEDRSFDGLSPDDITALVVDIHGGGLAAAGGPQGACCTMM
jgi:serine/threonine protein phosphatase PrpC